MEIDNSVSHLMFGDYNSKILILGCGCDVMGGWNSCCVAGWLLPFGFL